jgi:hypothetical protein
VPRANTQLVIDNRDISYASYTKLHPGWVSWYFTYIHDLNVIKLC